MKLSLRAKITLSLCSVAAVLIISTVISVMEYRSMRSYVSDLIADDIKSINAAQKLSDITNKYNLDILAVIGDDFYAERPDFDETYFMSNCDSLRSTLKSNTIMPLTDSVTYAYSAYMLTSLELENVLESYFIDSRTWYFDRLQPSFERLRSDIDKLDNAIYNDLEKNSKTFERGFYRSVVPGICAVMVGVLLVFLLLFFILIYYVNPVYKMRDALDSFLKLGKKYTYTFEGDDQLAGLNDCIIELTEENSRLKKRVKNLKTQKDELEDNQ